MSNEHPSFPQCEFCLEDAIGAGHWPVEDDYDWGPLCAQHAIEKKADADFDCFDRHHSAADCPLKRVAAQVTTLTVGAEYSQYRQVLASNAKLPPAEWTFKSDPAYTQILEHVSPEQGNQYLDLIVSEFPDQWRRFRLHYSATALENDALGRSTVASFDRMGIECSPTNLRYLWHALLFWDHVRTLGLTQVDVVEIGGGYGGLALWIRRLATSQKSILRSYTIIDVPEAGAIQAAFCREVTIPVRVVDGTSSYAVGDLMDLLVIAPYLISAYAFSEFSAEVREFYVREVIDFCQHGMLLWNMIPLYPFTDAEITAEVERPLTGPGNLLVRF